MKKLCTFICFAGFTCISFAQYKNDNVLYKTVFTQDLCNEINNNPGHLFLDVRSPGEYADTSSMGMNLGRFKNAVNIEVRNLGKRISEISNYKDKPVFVYCSHSQRSRRASKMLADSGFTRVYNINAGMTGLRQLPAEDNGCLYKKLESKNAYSIISAADLCNKISKKGNNIFLLDVRSDSSFKHISLDARINAYGYFKNSTNIPLANLETKLSEIPADKEIIIIDLYGDDGAKAAELLSRKNYSQVRVLIEGIDRLLNTDSRGLRCLSTAYISDLPYRIINAQELKPFLETTKEYLFLDARTTEEFTNQHKNYWQNQGHLANAVNIPAAELEKQWAKIENYKTKPVIVYVFSSGKEAHESARKLVKNGFTNVMVLQGGVFNVGWTAANIKGFSSLAALRVNVPPEN
jgi:rhodanese-related sulfurtransferase